MELKTDTLFPADSTSLITRASQILALFIALGLAGMISSILVSERISSSADKIDLAGSLRILATKVPYSFPIDRANLDVPAVKNFQKSLENFISKNQLQIKSEPKLAALFKRVEINWVETKSAPTLLKTRKALSTELDSMVNYFESEIDEEIRTLRLIQYSGFFMLVLISYVLIYRLQGTLITPFKLLMLVAKEAGQGNFTPRADERAKGELGLLAKSLNEMTKQLSLTYQEFEEKVADKTAELKQTNRSLDILYRSAHSLSSREQATNFEQFFSDLEQTLGQGKVYAVITGRDDNIEKNPREENSTINQLFPIHKDDQSFGSLVWETPLKLKPELWQEELLKAMTNLIASAIDLEHKRRAESRLEIMEERAVIARELHDSLAQSLSYLKLQISLLNKQFQKKLPQEQVSSTITEIGNGTNQAYRQLREILTTFRLKLDSGSIKSSIQEAVNEFSDKCNYKIELIYDLDANTLSPHQEIHLLQIIREALSNIHKHAEATAALVSVKINDQIILAEVEDNGCGQPKTSSKEGHFGLKIMNERAKSLGGTLEISQNSPRGTRVSLQFKTVSEH